MLFNYTIEAVDDNNLKSFRSKGLVEGKSYIDAIQHLQEAYSCIDEVTLKPFTFSGHKEYHDDHYIDYDIGVYESEQEYIEEY